MDDLLKRRFQVFIHEIAPTAAQESNFEAVPIQRELLDQVSTTYMTNKASGFGVRLPLTDPDRLASMRLYPNGKGFGVAPTKFIDGDVPGHFLSHHTIFARREIMSVLQAGEDRLIEIGSERFQQQGYRTLERLFIQNNSLTGSSQFSLMQVKAQLFAQRPQPIRAFIHKLARSKLPDIQRTLNPLGFILPANRMSHPILSGALHLAVHDDYHHLTIQFSGNDAMSLNQISLELLSALQPARSSGDSGHPYGNPFIRQPRYTQRRADASSTRGPLRTLRITPR